MAPQNFFEKLVLSLSVSCIGNSFAFSQDSVHQNVSLNEVAIYANTNLRSTDTQQIQQASDDIIKHIPGATLISRGNYAPEPILHGMGGGQINITIDGMRLFGACTDKMDPINSYVEPNNLQSIRAAFAPGNDVQGITIGGGIDFTLKQAQVNAADKWSGLAGIQYGTNGNASQALATLQYSTQRFALLVNGLYRGSQDYTAGNGYKIDYSQYSKWNGNIAAKYQLARNHVLSANYLQDDGYNIGYPALLMDVKYARASIGSLTWDYRNDEKKLYSVTAKLYANGINHAMDDTKRPKWQVPVHMDMPGTSRTIGGFAKAYFQLNKANRLAAQAACYQNKLHAEMTMYPESASPTFMLTIPDGIRRVADISISDKIALGNQWSLDLGSKLAYSASEITSVQGLQQISTIYQGDVRRNNFLYNIYGNINYRYSDNWLLQLDVAHGMRDATLMEYYAVYIFNRADNYDYKGNPALKAEHSWNIILNASYNKNTLRIDASLYHYAIQSYIAGAVVQDDMPMTNGAIGVKQYMNLPAAAISGTSLNLKFNVFPRLIFKSNNNFTYGKDANNNALPFIAPLQSVNSLTFMYKGFTSLIEVVSNAAQHHVSSYYGETATPAFSIFNFRIDKTFSVKARHINCSVAVSNILDKNYYEHLDVAAIPQPGRSCTASVTYLF